MLASKPYKFELMHLAFYDSPAEWQKMLPLSYTRPVADLRVGILKIHEKWARHLQGSNTTFRSEEYLDALFAPPQEKSLTILGNVLPTDELLTKVGELKGTDVLVYEDQIVAGYFEPDEAIETTGRTVIHLPSISQVHYPWDLFSHNGQELRKDFALLTAGRTSWDIVDLHTKTYGDNIFLEEGATVKAAILNAENGPIYLGKDSEVQEGALIRGPFALGEHSIVNMGGKMRGDNTIGPYCKVGGEVSNSVFQGFSNKGHDGFLGNSFIGEWCNLGADTNTSNLKNNYTNVKMWDFERNGFKDTGLQFCGLIMGDHSKCGINTMFNTGTSVGVSSNIFGEGFPRTIIPSFAWGGASGFSTYQTRKAFETAELAMDRRGRKLTDGDRKVLSHIFERTAQYRVWEKK